MMGSGLDVVKEIHKVKADSRIIVLTGYGNIPTAVAAVKSGAIDYLAKPADARGFRRPLYWQIKIRKQLLRRIQCRPIG